MKKLFLNMILFCACVSSSYAALQTASVFTSNMVLQRDRAVPVWGTGTVGEAVQVTCGGQTKNTIVDSNGKWRINLDAMSANATEQQLVVTGLNTITLSGILVGDIWLAAGQSNMKWRLNQCADYQGIADSATNTLIRLLNLPKVVAAEPQGSIDAAWAVCSSATASPFSAIGIIFALKIQPEIGVPVGVVSVNDGSTSVECWVSNETIQEPLFSATKEVWDDFLADWETVNKPDLLLARLNKHISTPTTAAAYEMPHPSVSTRIYPTGCYNAMLSPLMPMAVTGVLWRQGEANTPRAAQYRDLMPVMVAEWREKFENPDLPFIQGQLPEWGAIDSAEMRESQYVLTQTEPHVHMVVLIDADTGGNVHSPNKQVDGSRMGDMALASIYGQSIPHQGPIYSGMQMEGSSVRLSFDHVVGGLMIGERESFTSLTVNPTPTAAIANFKSAGSDNVFYAATAVIDGTNVVVSSSSVPNPVSVRYAWEGVPAGCNLYNDAGFPAMPFRTDDLPLTTEGYYTPKLDYFIYNNGVVLQTSVSGAGSIAQSSTGTDPYFESGEYGVYKSGTVVSLTATPAAGDWQFDGWGGSASGTENPVDVTVSSEKSITAIFSDPSAPPPATNFSEVAWWKLDETSGSIASDSSSNRLDMTVQNGVVLNQPGQVGTAFSFDGVDDMLSRVADSKLVFNGKAVTFSAWINPASLNPSGWNMIFGSARDGLALGVSKGLLRFTHVAKGDAAAGPSVATNQWTHIAVSFDDTGPSMTDNLKYYVNGVLVGTFTFDRDLSGGVAMTALGARGDSTAYFNGLIDDARIYDSILTDAEITAIYTYQPSDAEVLYQDTFDGDGLAANTGVGGGAGYLDPTGESIWQDDGDASWAPTGGSGGNRGLLHSLNGFALSEGFKMTVQYTVAASSVERFSIGMMGNNPVDSWSSNNNWLSDNRGHYGIGLNVFGDGIGPSSLTFADGASITVLSSKQTLSAGTHTLELTVTTNDTFSYSIDGAPATTGEIVAGAGVFDLTQLYYFAAYAQDDVPARSIQSVTIERLETLPEADLFVEWLNLYPGLGSATNYTDDVEPDGLNNLAEYALGGNPTNHDASVVMPRSALSAVGGTNWLCMVYSRRADAAARGLTYTVLHGTNLVTGLTHTNHVVGVSSVTNGFESVTNQVPTDVEVAQFMQLLIEMN